MKRFAALLLAACATPAAAQDADRFCPNRPSLGTNPCTVLPGHMLAEISGIDWTREDDGTDREDTILYGDMLLRIGVARATEVEIGWTSFGTKRTRDFGTGAIERRGGSGDVRLAIQQNLRNPDGDGLSFAIQPFVTLPTGGTAIGAGDWAAGLVVPIAWAVGSDWLVDVTGTTTAAVDEDGHGRHFNISGVAGLGRKLTDAVTLTGEMYVERDDEPDDATTQVQAAVSVAWQPRERFQLDLLTAFGLNHDSLDARIALGGAILF